MLDHRKKHLNINKLHKLNNCIKTKKQRIKVYRQLINQFKLRNKRKLLPKSQNLKCLQI